MAKVLSTARLGPAFLLPTLWAVLLSCAVSLTAIAADGGSSTGQPVSTEMDAIRSYCSNIRDLAKDARHRRQFAELKGLSEKVDTKIQELRKRTAEYKKWYELRRTFADKATKTLVQIYSRMRPESAAAQLSVMNQMTAAALLIKLNTRISSAILNEIEPAKAAALSGIISAAARKTTAGDPS